jgi:predicted DCC family thiol-disulfide oxidoreductase YuxK
MTDREHPLILFDGICGLCNRSLRFVVERDPGGVFQFASQQSVIGQKTLAARGFPEEPGTMVVLDRHHIYLRSDGIVFILQNLSRPWPMVGWLLGCLPRAVRDAGYQWVARNRYKLFGKLESCPVWPAGIRRRVIE